ncbi:ATP-binding protein [Frigidibacter sp. ROC022]|uniref:ATP-binding protein n=1 Tax=Frigidibacter sp. ROC022 TaxID=2971796 RepID=UPI00215B76B4|nr:ATP-binding protein [Frigidibacter sp. ROC022]MCR8726389.1 ATP-binding protein [Frigidibacter sp. ROC022]
MTVDTDAVIKALPLPAVLVDTAGRVAVANAGADALFGIDLTGRHHVAVLRQPDLLDSVDRVLSRGEGAEVRYRVRRGQSDQVFRVTVTPAGEGPPNAALLVFEDATPVEAAGQMRRDFVANVSHELKTPLTAVLGFIETLRSTARDDPQARERFLGIMEREAKRMNRLVSDLLSLSRVEDEERMRPRQTVDLAPLLRRTLATLKAVIEQAGSEIEIIEPGEPLPVPGDPDQLQQVMANLIENALKYGRPRGKVTVRLCLPVQDDALGRPAARIEVEDQGEGIDPIHLPRLTERFYRVDAHRSRSAGGTGLGLAIVKHIVNRHRGRLAIDSKPGEGSRFSILLPAADPDATAA